MSSPNEPANAPSEEEDELLFSDEESTSEELKIASYQPQILGTWKVLVVDDEDAIRELCEQLLEKFGLRMMRTRHYFAPSVTF